MNTRKAIILLYPTCTSGAESLNSGFSRFNTWKYGFVQLHKIAKAWNKSYPEKWAPTNCAG